MSVPNWLKSIIRMSFWFCTAIIGILSSRIMVNNDANVRQTKVRVKKMIDELSYLITRFFSRWSVYISLSNSITYHSIRASFYLSTAYTMCVNLGYSKKQYWTYTKLLYYNGLANWKWFGSWLAQKQNDTVL